MVTIRYLERGKEGSEGKETEEVKGGLHGSAKGNGQRHISLAINTPQDQLPPAIRRDRWRGSRSERAKSARVLTPLPLSPRLPECVIWPAHNGAYWKH